jgi:tRNA (guanine-N7-)-methyltransferase
LTTGGNGVAAGYLGLADLGEPPLELNVLFARSAPVELEIGAGRGDFALEYARAHPEVNLLAIERKLVILRRAGNKLRAAGLENLVFLHAEARYLLENYIRAESLRAVHVYFPDPWPKKRHAKRRVIQHETIRLIIRALTPGGAIYFRSDVEAYFTAAVAMLTAHERLEQVDTPADVAAVPTAYESRFVRYQKPIYRAAFRAKP